MPKCPGVEESQVIVPNEDVWSAIASLELDDVVRRAASENNWTEEFSREAEARYRGFLYLCATERGFSKVPNEAIDAVWHSHIIYTRKYTEDCRGIFGEYLQHQPSSLDGGDDLKDDYLQTKAAFERAFGIPYGVSSESCKGVDCSDSSQRGDRASGECN